MRDTDRLQEPLPVAASIERGNARLPSSPFESLLSSPRLADSAASGTAIAIVYLALIAAAELTTSLLDARAGLILHVGLLCALLVHAALVDDQPRYRFLVSMSLAPLIRILSLSMPLGDLDLVYWYAVIGAPLLVAAFVVVRTLGLTRRDLGFVLTDAPLQLAVGATGIALGFIEYAILEPQPLIERFSLVDFVLPAVILGVFTGFAEEFIFRGILQGTVSDVLGQAALVYVAMLFAVLHIGYESVPDFGFVFCVGLAFAVVVHYTRSLLGVTLAHMTTNVTLFLIAPFIFGP